MAQFHLPARTFFTALSRNSLIWMLVVVEFGSLPDDAVLELLTLLLLPAKTTTTLYRAIFHYPVSMLQDKRAEEETEGEVLGLST